MLEVTLVPRLKKYKSQGKGRSCLLVRKDSHYLKGTAHLLAILRTKQTFRQ